MNDEAKQANSKSLKALVFGANGQDGYYLNALCQSRGVEMVGCSRSGNWLRADVSLKNDVEFLIVEHRPDFVFHLAANSTTRHSALFENHETISTGALNILEAVKTHCPECKVFLCGSGVQFKNIGQPISENDAFDASSPYAIARIQSAYAARYYRSLGQRVYVGYLFHHDSPRRPENHVSQMIASAVSRIRAGSQETLVLGDVSVQKEWTFAGDVVEAMWTLMQQDEVFEAAVGSGMPYSIEQWLQSCFGLIGKNWKDYIQLRQHYTPEYQRLVCNPSTLRGLGWSPTVSFDALARLMVEHRS